MLSNLTTQLMLRSKVQKSCSCHLCPDFFENGSVFLLIFETCPTPLESPVAHYWRVVLFYLSMGWATHCGQFLALTWPILVQTWPFLATIRPFLAPIWPFLVPFWQFLVPNTTIFGPSSTIFGFYLIIFGSNMGIFGSNSAIFGPN